MKEFFHSHAHIYLNYSLIIRIRVGVWQAQILTQYCRWITHIQVITHVGYRWRCEWKQTFQFRRGWKANFLTFLVIRVSVVDIVIVVHHHNIVVVVYRVVVGTISAIRLRFAVIIIRITRRWWTQFPNLRSIEEEERLTGKALRRLEVHIWSKMQVMNLSWRVQCWEDWTIQVHFRQISHGCSKCSFEAVRLDV